MDPRREPRWTSPVFLSSAFLPVVPHNSTGSKHPRNLIKPKDPKKKYIITMKFITLTGLLALAISPALATPAKIYPAPCGRSVPSGRCATEKSCLGKGGFYVQRDCPFYNVQDVGCCYGLPDDD